MRTGKIFSPVALVVAAMLSPGLRAQETEADLNREEVAKILESIFVAEPGSVGLIDRGAGERSLLGASFSDLSEVLRKQLDLKHGLTVDYVASGSACEKAGVLPMDILLKVDDQLVFTAPQLRKLLYYHGAGKSLSLEVMRKGEIKKLECTLKEVAVAGDASSLEKILLKALGDGKLIGEAVKRRGKFTTISSINGETMVVSDQDGKRHLRITSSGGKVIFDAPVESEADLEKVPEQYRKIIRRVMAFKEE